MGEWLVTFSLCLSVYYGGGEDVRKPGEELSACAWWQPPGPMEPDYPEEGLEEPGSSEKVGEDSDAR